MSDPSRRLRRRAAVLTTSLVAAVTVCVLTAVKVQRDASERLQQLAHVELQAATLARQFRSDIDNLHGALLRIGIDSPEEISGLVGRRRSNLTAWLEARRAEEDTDQERIVLQRIADEMRSYFAKLDALAGPSKDLSVPLSRDTVVMLDDGANRLQSIADDYAAAHDAELRSLLLDSLGSLRAMRNLVLVCLALLLAAVATVVVFLYRDMVLPLQEQLVGNEALLAAREKLAALGTLAAGVAHEIRNPLTAIKARLYTLRRALLPEDNRNDIQAIAYEVDRLERIARDVLGYAHPAEPARGLTELSSWLREFAAFVEPELTAGGIALFVDATANPAALIDTNQLRQIMLNLVRNAQESFQGRPGRIELSLHRAQAASRGKAAEVAVLSVSDNGPGIPANIQSRLFDPFFTTKATGTGIGLSIVAQLVANQGGEIAFQSSAGAGSRFSVRLPVAESAAQNHLK